MVIKRKIESILKNWKQNRNQAIMIVGARQVGKSYSIRKFLSEEFTSFEEINFANDSYALDLFSKLKNEEDFYTKLSLIRKKELIPGKSAIFFDEIQLIYKRRKQLEKNNPDIFNNTIDLITLIKPLVQTSKYRYAISGSLLGTSLDGILLNPTGYLDIHTMYPLDFEEYLWAKNTGNEVIDYLKKCYEGKNQVEQGVHSKFIKLFNEYVLVGGMPEAVKKFIETLDFKNVDLIQQQINNAYSLDITQYAPNELKVLINEAFKALPSELNKKNKRFVKTKIDYPGIKNMDISDCFLWLSGVGVAIPVFNVSEPTYPLLINENRKTLKLFSNDVGLLSSLLLGNEGRIKILNEELEINYGAPYENVIAQELKAHGYDSLHYWNDKKSGELDFVIEKNASIIPIEVKSGKSEADGYYNHKALTNCLNVYGKISEAVVLSRENAKRETDKIINLPIYMIMFFKK